MPLTTLFLADVITTVKSRADERAALWWRSLFGEFVAGLHIYLLRHPWTVNTPTVLPATASPARIPVVLVHGYLCNHRIWDDIANALRVQGHAVFAVNLEPFFTSIDNYAPIVETAVTKLCRQTGAARVALVGHSMGGLTIRAWMRAHGTQRVARVLTLASPHAGTQSQWLAELSASETDATRSLIRIALTPQDNIVYPQRAQILPGISPVVFESMGHLQMCLDPSVITWVCEQLAILGDDV